MNSTPGGSARKGAPDRSRHVAAHLDVAHALTREHAGRLPSGQLCGNAFRDDLALGLGEDARLGQRQAMGQRDGRAIADRVDPLIRGREGARIDRDPSPGRGEARLDEYRRAAMRRHGKQEVERPLGGVGETDRSGVHLHGLMVRQECDGGVAQERLEPAALHGAGHGQRDRHRAEDLDLDLHPAPPETLARQDRQLEGSGRAAVWRAEDADREPPPSEALEGRTGARRALAIPHVDAVLDQPRYRLRGVLGAESDDHGIGRDRLAIDRRPDVRGIEPLDMTLPDHHPALRQPGQQASALGQRRLADDLPRLAQAHGEVGAAVDQDDLDSRREAAKRDGRGDSAEAGPQDQHASHDDLPGRW